MSLSSDNRWVAHRGQITPLASCLIPVNDLAIMRGYGMFDYFRTYNGHPFHMPDHLNRFEHSAAQLGLSTTMPREELQATIEQLLKAQPLRDAGIRLLLTGGYSADSMTSESPNLFVLSEPLPVFNSQQFAEGVHLMLSAFDRELPQVKTINYLQSIRLLPERKKNNQYEVLYHGKSGVTEASRSNFFLVKNGTVRTTGENVLLGITRKVVLGLAGKLGIPVVQERVEVDALYDADEAFLTGTNTKVMPVVKVGEQTIGNGQPGEVTRALMDAFNAYTEQWGTIRP